MLISEQLETCVRQQVQEFHQRKLDGISAVKLKGILKKKNAYMYAAKGIRKPFQLVRAVMDAYESSQEETYFGKFFEDLAEFAISNHLHGVKKPFKGIGFEFERAGVVYLMVVKSGISWGNSRSKKKLDEQFANAVRQVKKERGENVEVKCINGCAYGNDEKQFDHYKRISGQEFWEFLTGDAKFYLRIVNAIIDQSRLFSKLYRVRQIEVRSRLVTQLGAEFSTETGDVDWEKLIKFTSAR